jgi:hypothetical protein
VRVAGTIGFTGYGGEVNDGVGVFGKQIGEVGAADVADDASSEARDGGVDADNLISAARPQLDQRSADEAFGPGDHDLHRDASADRSSRRR